MSELKAKGRVLITRPCHGTYEYGNVLTMSDLLRDTQSGGYACGFHFCKGSSIPKLRTQAVEAAIKANVDYLLCVDSDMMVAPDSLLKLLSHDRDIISGVCVAKQPPFLPIIARKQNGKHLPITAIPQNTVLDDIDMVGFGFILIKVSVFKEIKRPWFEMDENCGEDQYFCDKARAAGFKISIDTSCQIGHIGNFVYTIEDFWAFNGQENISPEPLIVSPNGKALVN